MGVVLRRTFELGRVHVDIRPRELAHLLELLRRPRGLRRATAADDQDLAYGRRADCLDRRVRRVGRGEFLRSEREHARDVQRHVPVADHDCAVDVQVELELLIIGVAVVPGDELRGRPRAWELLPRDPESLVGLRAEGVDHGVEDLEQVHVREVAADLDVAEEAKARLLRDALERARDALELRMVGRNAEPDEAPWRRQALDHVHLDAETGVEQSARGIKPGRARADHGNSDGALSHRTIVLSPPQRAGAWSARSGSKRRPDSRVRGCESTTARGPSRRRTARRARAEPARVPREAPYLELSEGEAFAQAEQPEPQPPTAASASPSSTWKL